MQATANKQGRCSSLGVVDGKHGDGVRHSQDHQAVESQQGPAAGTAVHSRVDASLRMGCSNQEGLLTLKTSPSVQPCTYGGGRRLAVPCIRSACGRFTIRAPLHVRADAPPSNRPTPSHQLDGTCCFRVSFAAVQVARQPTKRPTRLMVMRDA